MGNRFLLFLLVVGLVCVTIFMVVARPVSCTDPLGCALLPSGKAISIGGGVISSGPDLPVSLEIQHGVQLAARTTPRITGHALAFLPDYSPCLPGEPSGSSIDLAATNRALVILGPTCAASASDFLQRATRAGQTVIAPIPRALPAPANILAFAPNQESLVQQAAQQLSDLGYTKLAVNAALDQPSQDFAAAICAALTSHQIECALGGSPLDPAQVNAVVAVSLDENVALSAAALADWPEVPKIFICLTLPQTAASDPAPTYWIGPRAWDEIRPFVRAYQTAYQAAPVSLAAWVSYESAALAGRSLQAVAVDQWDGSWVIPRSALQARVLADGKNTALFKYSCSSAAPGCPDFPLALYQLTGNEYTLAKP